MSGTLVTVFVALIVSVISPMIVALIGGRQRASEAEIAAQAKAEEDERAARIRREEREADWERQDEVARRAEAAAQAVEESNTRVRERAEAIAKNVEEVKQQAAKEAELLHGATAEVATKVEAVKDKTEEAAQLLVDSNDLQKMVAEVINGKLDQIHTLVNSNLTTAMEGKLEALQGQLVALKKVPVAQMTDDDVDAIEEVQRKIKSLQKSLDERKKETAAGEQQAKS